MRRSFLVPTAFALVAFSVALLGLVGFAPADQGRGVIGGRFDVLLLPAEESPAAVGAALRNAGEEPLDRLTAYVEIEDFSGRTVVSVAELTHRFEPDDPRLDPFLQALPDLFIGYQGDQPLELVFLPREEAATAFSLPRRYLELSRILEGHQFRLAGLDLLAPVVFAVIALLVGGIATKHTSWRSWPVLVALVPTVVYALSGGPPGVIRAGMVLFVWSLWQDYSRDRELEWLTYGVHPLAQWEFRAASTALALVILVSFLAVAGEPDGERRRIALGFTFYLLALGSLSTTSFLVAARRFSRTDHKLFIPVSIFPGSSLYGRREWRQFITRAIVVITVAVVLLLPLLILFSPGGERTRVDGTGVNGTGVNGTGVNGIRVSERRAKGSLIIPMSIEQTGTTAEGESPEDNPDEAAVLLRDAQQVDLEQFPLSTAGYIAHRRYQESLLFGGAFAVPDRDETVQLVRFAREEGRIRDVPETVITFGEEWVREQLVPSPGSAYQLMIDGSRSIIVTPGVVATVQVPRQRLLYYAIVVIIGGVPLLFAVRLPYRSRIDTVGRLVKGVRKTA